MLRSCVQISLIFLSVVLSGCFGPPEFSNEPEIAFKRLHLTDTATLVLTFDVRDGDGDIGLDPYEIEEPFHNYSVVTNSKTAIFTSSTSNGNTYVENREAIVSLRSDLPGPYYTIPVTRFTGYYLVYKGISNNVRLYEPFYVNLFERAGTPVYFSDFDERPDAYNCEDYEIVSFFSPVVQQVNGRSEVVEVIEEVDTVFVRHNPYHFNISLTLELKRGDDYIPFDLDECEELKARFPVFKRSNIGRPLDGSISYAFFSVLFQDPEFSPLLTETMRLRFYIYDRTLTPDGELQKSNEVYTPDFKLLDLRQGDLVAD